MEGLRLRPKKAEDREQSPERPLSATFVRRLKISLFKTLFETVFVTSVFKKYL